MFKRLLSRPAILIVLGITFSLASSVASAQTADGSITVQTMDTTKALVPAAHLVLTDNETGVAREGTTLSSGTYTFTALPPSTYRLTADHAGFSTVNYDSIVVQAGVATPVNIILKVGATTQEVSISAVSQPVIETSSNQLSTSINLEEVNDLPVNGRSLIGLQALAPGYSSVTPTSNGTFNGTAAASYGASIDGVIATSLRMDAGSGSRAAITFRTEDSQEFTVQSKNLDPSQGGRAKRGAVSLCYESRHQQVLMAASLKISAMPPSTLTPGAGFQNPRLPKLLPPHPERLLAAPSAGRS